MSRLQATVVTVCAVIVVVVAVAAVLIYRDEAEQQRELDERIACGRLDDNPFTSCGGRGG